MKLNVDQFISSLPSSRDQMLREVRKAEDRKRNAKLTPSQREALEWLVKGESLRGLAHGVTINHLKMKRLIEDSDTITDAGRAALTK